MSAARPTNVAPFAQNLDHELAALMRGASLECLVCGEFVMHARERVIFCPECGTQLGEPASMLDGGALEFAMQAG